MSKELNKRNYINNTPYPLNKYNFNHIQYIFINYIYSKN